MFLPTHSVHNLPLIHPVWNNIKIGFTESTTLGSIWAHGCPCDVWCGIAYPITLSLKLSALHQYKGSHHDFQCSLFIKDSTVIKLKAEPCASKNSTEQSPSWEANSQLSSKEIPRLLWNPKSPLLVPIVSQLHPFHNFSHSFPMIHRNIIVSSTPRSSEWFLFFRQKFYIHSHLSQRDPYPVHLILLDLISLTSFGEAYKLWRPVCIS